MNEKQILESKPLVNIIFVFFEDKVLLAIKARKIGMGKRNGYGGGVKPNQTMIESAIEELAEESGLIAQPEDLRKIGLVDFHNYLDDGSVKVVRCEVFTLEKFSGQLHETEEMKDPQWFPTDQLPFNNMMVGDREWIPKFFSGEYNYAEIHQADQQTRLVKPVIFKKLP